jgi:hypothetical protein
MQTTVSKIALGKYFPWSVMQNATLLHP